MNESEHITYFVDEPENEVALDVDSFLTDFDKTPFDTFAEMQDYDLNYSVKQLLLICEYYNISKSALKINKMKKSDIIEQLVLFENDPKNFEISRRRKQMWFYINELREDKFMKKYILWAST
jgi:hypothetical protein